MFGSRTNRGTEDFGITVPPLLAYDKPGGRLVEVYPHGKDRGPVQTIAGYLRQPPGGDHAA